MYLNSGYLNNSRVAFIDKSRPLIVGSCGTYRLSSKYKLPTWWHNGRIDWQLLYVASGKAHFYIKGQDVVVTSGNMVLFQPKQEMHYEYFGKVSRRCIGSISPEAVSEEFFESTIFH